MCKFEKLTKETAPVGSRLLILPSAGYKLPLEAVVKEWGPSGQCVCLQHAESDKEQWQHSDIGDGLPLLVEKLEQLPSAAHTKC